MEKEHISKALETVANAIKEAVIKGNVVWISTATGETVLLDDECKIGFMQHR